MKTFVFLANGNPAEYTLIFEVELDHIPEINTHLLYENLNKPGSKRCFKVIRIVQVIVDGINGPQQGVLKAFVRGCE